MVSRITGLTATRLSVRMQKMNTELWSLLYWGYGPRYFSWHSDSLRGGRSGDRIPVGGEIFRTRPDRPWGPPTLLYNGYRVFSGGNAAGTWRWTPTPSSAGVKERIELYLYSAFGLSWPVLGWNFTFAFKLNSVALVRTRTIPTERPPPVGEVNANFCG